MHLPTPEQLERLKTWDVPTVSNAIESFGVRPQSEGFCDTTIKCLFPQMGRMIGFAATVQTSGLAPDSEGRISEKEHWEAVLKVPEPRVVAAEDLDPPPRQGALFGEVNSNLHKKLGCIGLVTNGAVRDLDEVESLGFHYFARSECVSHSYVHYVSSGKPVTIGGLVIRPGDILYGDKHGVLKIPPELIDELPEACESLLRREKVIIDFCRSDGFTVEGLDETIRRLKTGKY